MLSAILLLGQAAFPSPVAPGATLRVLGEGYSFTEGPTADRKGNVYFTDQPNDRILRWNIDGTVEEWLQPAGRSNGLAFDKKGNLIACADEKNELWSISPDKKVTVLVNEFEGKLLNGPNDVWVRPDGGLYFTDPLYVRPWWKRDPKMQQPGQAVFLRTRDGKVRRVAEGLKQPNGIVGTPRGSHLFVADIGDNKTWRYKIERDGSLTGKTLWVEMGSDGMALDNEGFLYLTGRGVSIFDRTGKPAGKVEVPEGWTANVTFGGKDRKTLFITAMGKVYGLEMRTRGVE